MRDRMFGWARRLDKGLLPWLGPAQLGAGYEEQPYERPADALCPVCHQAFSLHTMARPGGQSAPSRLVCPRRAAG